MTKEVVATVIATAVAMDFSSFSSPATAIRVLLSLAIYG